MSRSFTNRQRPCSATLRTASQVNGHIDLRRFHRTPRRAPSYRLRFPSFLELGTAVATGIPTSSMFRRLCLSSDLGSNDFPRDNDFDAAVLLATFARAVVSHRIAYTQPLG